MSVDPQRQIAAAAREAVRQSARQGAIDRYLAALLAPREARDDLVALAAATGEIAAIARAVKEPTMGEIRLQWWRDALAGPGQGGHTGHPVADALGAALVARGIASDALEDLLEARAFDLYGDPMPNDAAFAGYLARTEGLPFRLAARLLGVADGPELATLCEAAGRAYGAARLLAELPLWLSRGRMPLPESRFSAAGLALADLDQPGAAPVLATILAGFATDARAAIAEARAAARRLPRAAATACLPIALVEPYLRRIERSGRDPLREVVEITPLQRTWSLWRSSVGGGW